MKRDGIYAIEAGMILTLVLWLIVVDIIWPASVSLYLIPISVFIILWLNAWQVTKDRLKAATA